MATFKDIFKKSFFIKNHLLSPSFCNTGIIALFYLFVNMVYSIDLFF